MLFPKYDDDKMTFIDFVKDNKEIFDELLRSGKYRLGTNIGIKNPSFVLHLCALKMRMEPLLFADENAP